MKQKIIKIIHYVIDIFVWLAVAITVLSVGVFNAESWMIRWTSLAALWLAGYWTLRSIRAQREADLRLLQLEKGNAEIKFQRDRHIAFFELTHDGIIVLDKNNQILRINDAITDITGYSYNEAVGHQCSKVFRCEKYKEMGLAFGLAYLSIANPTHYEEITAITKDGRPIDIGVRCTKAKHFSGHRGDSLILIRDLSKIHAAEVMEHDFVSMTSHQLFTPLSIIRGHIALMIEGSLGKITEKQKNFLDQSMHATKKMVSLVSELLSISRLEERKITLNFAPTNIVDVIDSTISELEPLAARNSIHLISKISRKSIPLVVIDGEKISQVMQNIIDNAIKYTPKKGTVQIDITVETDNLVISVSDNGIGIPKDDLPKLFQRFFRSSNTLSLDSKGTGLGLYIAKVIVERHQGKIWAESTENKGSTFYIALPR
jgi:two-component system sensor histidine kinase VicK